MSNQENELLKDFLSELKTVHIVKENNITYLSMPGKTGKELFTFLQNNFKHYAVDDIILPNIWLGIVCEMKIEECRIKIEGV